MAAQQISNQTASPAASLPPFAPLFLHGLSDDPSLGGTEKIVIANILNLQRMNQSGRCCATNQYLADCCGISRSQLKRVMGSINAKHDAGETEWKIAKRIFRGRNRSNLTRVIVPDVVRQLWRDPPQHPARARQRRQQQYQQTRVLRDEAAGTLFARRSTFNLFASTREGENFATRLGRAVEAGEVTGVIVEGAERHLLRVRQLDHAVYLHLGVDGHPTQSEPLLVPTHQLGRYEFFA